MLSELVSRGSESLLFYASSHSRLLAGKQNQKKKTLGPKKRRKKKLSQELTCECGTWTHEELPLELCYGVAITRQILSCSKSLNPPEAHVSTSGYAIFHSVGLVDRRVVNRLLTAHLVLSICGPVQSFPRSESNEASTYTIGPHEKTC